MATHKKIRNKTHRNLQNKTRLAKKMSESEYNSAMKREELLVAAVPPRPPKLEAGVVKPTKLVPVKIRVVAEKEKGF